MPLNGDIVVKVDSSKDLDLLLDPEIYGLQKKYNNIINKLESLIRNDSTRVELNSRIENFYIELWTAFNKTYINVITANITEDLLVFQTMKDMLSKVFQIKINPGQELLLDLNLGNLFLADKRFQSYDLVRQTKFKQALKVLVFKYIDLIEQFYTEHTINLNGKELVWQFRKPSPIKQILEQ
ncbi:MAG: hypothetical protein ABI721_01505 [Candidatus Dojkabacteria bacterium]